MASIRLYAIECDFSRITSRYDYRLLNLGVKDGGVKHVMDLGFLEYKGLQNVCIDSSSPELNLLLSPEIVINRLRNNNIW